MNIIGWANDHLDYRCAFMPCYLNIYGETEKVEVKLMPKGDFRFRKILIERYGAPNLEVLLSDVDAVTESLYYFDIEDGRGATLLIPVPPEEDNGD